MRPLIIMPAYNVENHIGNLLERMSNYKDNMIIINDGSTDNTEDIIKKIGIKFLANQSNKGISYSIKKGIDWGKNNGFDRIILIDADEQHDPKYIPYFERMLLDYDYVYGSRFNRDKYYPSCKFVSNVLANLLIYCKWKVHIKDVACGFKGFKLYKGIEDNISENGGYSLVYDTLFYSLENKFSIINIDINAIYFPEDFWFTRTNEIRALISSLNKFPTHNSILENDIKRIEDSIKQKKDFQVVFDDKIFYAFYLIDKEGYIIQSDLEKLYKWLDEN